MGYVLGEQRSTAVHSNSFALEVQRSETRVTKESPAMENMSRELGVDEVPSLDDPLRIIHMTEGSRR